MVVVWDVYICPCFSWLQHSDMQMFCHVYFLPNLCLQMFLFTGTKLIRTLDIPVGMLLLEIMIQWYHYCRYILKSTGAQKQVYLDVLSV